MTKNIFLFICLLLTSILSSSCKQKYKNDVAYDRNDDVKRYLTDVIIKYPYQKDFYLIFLENSYCNACSENDFSEFFSKRNKKLPILLIASKEEPYFVNLSESDSNIVIFNDSLSIYEKYGLFNPKTLYFLIEKDLNINRIR